MSWYEKSDIVNSEVEDIILSYDLNREAIVEVKLIGEVEELISENAENAKGAIYMFYETIDKFHFKSLETLMSQDSKRKFIYQPKNMHTEETGGIKDLSTTKFEIDSFTVLQTFNILENMQKGMYAATLITYDFERMSYEEHNYNYIAPTFIKTEQQHLSTGDIVTIKSDKLNVSKNSHIDRGKKIAEG